MFVFTFYLLGKACAWTLKKCRIWAWRVFPKTPRCRKHFRRSKSWVVSMSCSAVAGGWRETHSSVVCSHCAFPTLGRRCLLSSETQADSWKRPREPWVSTAFRVTGAPPATSPCPLETTLPRHTSQLACVHVCMSVCEHVHVWACGVCSGCSVVITDL